MNTKQTADLVEENRVVPMTADVTNEFSPEVLMLYGQIGINQQVVPILAVFPPGDGAPIVLEGPVSQEDVLAALKKAGPSNPPDDAS